MLSQSKLPALKAKFQYYLHKISPRSCLFLLLGSGMLAFGMYNIHSLSGVTEGGVLGMILLLEQLFHISPSVSGFILNLLCYILGWKTLGKGFLFYSFVASTGFSVAYKICEQFEPLWPWLADTPLLAAILGAVFVGVSVGICVRMGGAPGGDDALAMSIAKITGAKIQWVYLGSDLVVLLLSLTYIPLQRIAYSLLTVLLSGQLIGIVQNMQLPRLKKEKRAADTQ